MCYRSVGVTHYCVTTLFRALGDPLGVWSLPLKERNGGEELAALLDGVALPSSTQIGLRSMQYSDHRAPLLDPRHERFAWLYSSGIPTERAYVQSGYAPCRDAQRLLRMPAIRGRVDFLVAERRDREIEDIEKTNISLRLSARRILEEMSNIAFSNMQAYLKFDKQRKPYFDLENLTEEQYAAIQEVTIETDRDGHPRIKVKLYDKRAALLDLGRHLGLTFTSASGARGSEDDAAQSQKPVAYVNIIIAGDDAPRATLAVNGKGEVIQNDEALRIIPKTVELPEPAESVAPRVTVKAHAAQTTRVERSDANGGSTHSVPRASGGAKRSKAQSAVKAPRAQGTVKVRNADGRNADGVAKPAGAGNASKTASLAKVKVRRRD